MALGFLNVHTPKEDSFSEADKKRVLEHAEAFLIGVSKKNREKNVLDDILPTYYGLCLGYLGDVVDALDNSNALKKELCLPLACLYSDTGLLLGRGTHQELLNAVGKPPKGSHEEMAKSTVPSLLKIKKMQLDRTSKIPGDITEHQLYNLKMEVHNKCHALQSWWGHAYVTEKAPESIEGIWEKKGKKDLRLSNNCANLSLELLDAVKGLLTQPTYKIMTGENKHLEIEKGDKDAYAVFGRYYIADKFQDYAAFLFQDAFMYRNVLSRYSF